MDDNEGNGSRGSVNEFPFRFPSNDPWLDAQRGAISFAKKSIDSFTRTHGSPSGRTRSVHQTTLNL